MRQIFSTAFMLFLVMSVFGQHTIKGKVLDEKGNSLAGATVTVQNSSLGKTTDKNGSFLFDGLSKTHYTIKTSYLGFETTVVQANVDSEIVVILKSTSVSIDEITVTSLRANDKSPMAYTNLSKETLAKTNIGQDIPYLLSQTPSLVVSSDAGTGIGYTGFRIRGTDAARINVTINGIPYNDPDEQGAYWVDLPDFTSSVQSIQVQRGVGTSTNGAGAFGANINLQTDNYSPKASAESNVTIGSFNTLKATLKASTGLINGHWAIDTRLSSVKSDGYIERGWVRMKSYFVQAGYYSEKTTVKFVTFGGTEHTYHAWDGVPKDSLETHPNYNPCGFMGNDANGNPLYYQNQTDNYTQTHYQLIGVHSFSSAFNITGALHYTRGDGYYEEYKQDQTLKNYALTPFVLNDSTTIKKSDLVRQKIMGNDFAGAVFSLNYQKDNLQLQLGGAANRYWGQHWGDVTWVKNYIGNILPITEYYRSKVTKTDINVYLKSNYDITKQLNVYGDLQYRQVDYKLKGTNDQWDDAINAMQKLDVDKHFKFFNPKVGLFYRPNSNNDLFASFAVAHREPTRTNYTDGSANTWPTHETLYDTELGYKFHNQLLSVGANLYWMSYRNQLVLTGKINDIGEMLTENIDKSYRAGIELTGSVAPCNWFRWDASVTLSKNQITNFKEYVDIYDDVNWLGQQTNSLGNTPIAFSPELTGKSMLTFMQSGFEIGLQSLYTGKQYIDNTGSNDRSLAAYFVNNLRLSYELPVAGLRGIGFTVLVNNLLDKKYISNAWVYSSYYHPDATTNDRYEEFGFYPQAGRNILASVSIKF
jgi:iron complex outermembrane receptor protein